MKSKDIFGKIGNDYVYCCTIGQTIRVEIITYGAIIKALWVKDKNEQLENIVLGYNNIEDYVNDKNYIGATIGRTAGRIKGSIEIDGKNFALENNEGNNNLHGGSKSIDKFLWTIVTHTDNYLLLRTCEVEEFGKLPGDVTYEAEFLIVNEELIIEYRAKTSQTTYVNMTNHSYFNLSGKKTPITDHNLTIDSNAFYTLDQDCTPFQLTDVKQTPFELNKGGLIAEKFCTENVEICKVEGYDHPFVLDKPEVILVCPETGRRLVCASNQESIVVYSGNKLSDSFLKHQGICLEFSDVPGGIKRAGCSKNLLEVGNVYIHRTTYKFDCY